MFRVLATWRALGCTHRRRSTRRGHTRADRLAVQEIVKLGYSGDSADGDGVSATNMLTGNYAQSAMPTPMRTPRAEARGGDTILQDALDLKALQETVTPLKVCPHSGRRKKHCFSSMTCNAAPLNCVLYILLCI